MKSRHIDNEGYCTQKIKGAIKFIDKVKNEINRIGLKKSFVAEKMGLTNVHFSRVLNLHSPLTQEMKDSLSNYFWPSE